MGHIPELLAKHLADNPEVNGEISSFRLYGRPMGSRKASRCLLKLSVGLDVDSHYSEPELHVIFAGTTRRKWFAVNAYDLVLLCVCGIVQNVIDARLRNFLPSCKGIAYGRA